MLTQLARGETQKEQIEFVLEECFRCGTPFMIPKRLQRVLIENQETFYCPNGHRQHYTGKTEVQKLKDQLDQLQLEKEKQEEVLQNRWLDALGEKQKIEKQLKRVKNGVCPCCNRSFINLKKHMETKHKLSIPYLSHDTASSPGKNTKKQAV